jgi:lipoate-protein ligase A
LEGIETKAIASVPAQVANLTQFAPELTVEELSVALMEKFRFIYGSDGIVEHWGDSEIEKHCAATQLLPMIAKNSSNDWKLGHTPKFTFRGIEVERGRVMNNAGSLSFGVWIKDEL